MATADEVLASVMDQIEDLDENHVVEWQQGKARVRRSDARQVAELIKALGSPGVRGLLGTSVSAQRGGACAPLVSEGTYPPLTSD